MIDSPHSFYNLPYLIEGLSFALQVKVLMILSKRDFKRAWPSSFDHFTTYDSSIDQFFEATTVSPIDYFCWEFPMDYSFEMTMDSLSGVFLWDNDGFLSGVALMQHFILPSGASFEIWTLFSAYVIRAQSVYQLIHVQLVLLDWGSNQQNL